MLTATTFLILKPFILGKLIWTFVLLIVLPVFFYWLALSVVSRLTVNVASFPSLVIDILARKTPLILLLGLFPRAAKNAWNLVAKRFVTQGTGPGQPGEGWINELKKPENDLPKRSYSKEAVVCLGIIPVLIIV